MKLQEEPAYIKGLKDGKPSSRRPYNPPLSDKGRAYYLAGFNVGRGRSMFCGLTHEEHLIVKASLGDAENEQR